MSNFKDNYCKKNNKYYNGNIGIRLLLFGLQTKAPNNASISYKRLSIYI